MEDQEEKERGIMGKEREDEGKREGLAANMSTQNSLTEKEENCVEVRTEMEEKGREKGMEEGEMKKEVEAEVKVCQSVPDLQMSIIQGTDLFGYVGIEAVLDQMKRKTMKAGFEFNIMVVGECHTHKHRWCVISCCSVSLSSLNMHSEMFMQWYNK